MKFVLRPILTEIKEFYQKPISAGRFTEYLSKLQGDRKDQLAIAISGYNPMAGKHIIQKIEALEALNAETIMQSIISEMNTHYKDEQEITIEVVFNLADDLKGGWTNYYATDFDSKFKISGMASRNFCCPYFWTSESYTRELITKRTKEYLWRTAYWLKYSTPLSLEDHVKQEIFVCKNTLLKNDLAENLNVQKIAAYYEENMKSDAYDLIFNFFYGDNASSALAYKTFGIEENAGFEFVQFLSKNG